MSKIGYTVGKDKTYLDTVKLGYTSGADAIQIWTGSPYSNKSKLIDTQDANNTRCYVKDHDIYLISHSPYVINFARPDQKASQQRLVIDLENIKNLGGSGTVLHTGKNVKELKQSINQAEINFTENIRKVLEAVETPGAYILLENMCGSGTSMWCDMKSWSEYWYEYPFKKETKWCIDTAHLFAAGEYNISKRKHALRFYNDFNENIGWEYVDCIHFNGSKVPFGAKNDRHADIQEPSSGCIETKGLRQFARCAFANKTPVIMETPSDENYILDQLKLIKSWV
jgi:deoxyribonuclease-4